jgi:hypothetical protein
MLILELQHVAVLSSAVVVDIEVSAQFTGVHA